MSSSSNKSRENYLNNLTKKYTEKLTLKTPEEPMGGGAAPQGFTFVGSP